MHRPLNEAVVRCRVKCRRVVGPEKLEGSAGFFAPIGPAVTSFLSSTYRPAKGSVALIGVVVVRRIRPQPIRVAVPNNKRDDVIKPGSVALLSGRR